LGWSSACFQISSHYSGGFGHPRSRHFSFDTGARRVERLFVWFLMPHVHILAPRFEATQPHFAQLRDMWPPF
jgi:hypothetical protein